jgi:hypothetical protein
MPSASARGELREIYIEKLGALRVLRASAVKLSGVSVVMLHGIDSTLRR